MHTYISVLWLAALVMGSPLPQDFDIDALAAIPSPSPVSYATRPTIIAVNPTLLANQAAALVTASGIVEPTNIPDAKFRRDITLASTACSTAQPQPSGSGYVPQPDNAADFLAYTGFATSASSAPIPTNYVRTFVALNGETQGYGYLGYQLLSFYDTATCAAQCDQTFGCLSSTLR